MQYVHKPKSQGFFEHESDCTRFWLCRPSPTGTALEASLFRCPVGFLYDDDVRRCIRQEQAAPCDKVCRICLMECQEMVQLRLLLLGRNNLFIRTFVFKVPDVARIALEPAPYQLTVNQLEAFFYRYRFFSR